VPPKSHALENHLSCENSHRLLVYKASIFGHIQKNQPEIVDSKSLPEFSHRESRCFCWGAILLPIYGDGSKPYPPGEHQNSWDLWMFIPLKMVCIGIDP
jgi:hypothetical protein